MSKHIGAGDSMLLLWSILIAWFVPCSLALGGPPAGYRLIWGDQFDVAPLDSSNWSVGTRERDSAQQSRSAVTVDDGVLRIGIYTLMGKHFTGFVTTKRLFATKDAYFESRIRFRGAPGSWCACWLQSPQFGQRIGAPRESGVEVDVVEYRKESREGEDISDTVQFNLHWDGYGVFRKSLGEVWRSKATLESEWHTYAVWSTQDGFSFFVDGEMRWRTDKVSTEAEQEIRLTCEVRDNSWAGKVPSAGFGDKEHNRLGMEVDWVRVWGR